MRFRETLRDHLAGMEVTATLDEFAATVAAGPRWSSDGPALQPAGEGTDGLIARRLDALFRAEVTGRWRRLKPCKAPECRWLFCDRSRREQRVVQDGHLRSTTHDARLPLAPLAVEVADTSCRL